MSRLFSLHSMSLTKIRMYNCRIMTTRTSVTVKVNKSEIYPLHFGLCTLKMPKHWFLECLQHSFFNRPIYNRFYKFSAVRVGAE